MIVLGDVKLSTAAGLCHTSYFSQIMFMLHWFDQVVQRGTCHFYSFERIGMACSFTNLCSTKFCSYSHLLCQSSMFMKSHAKRTGQCRFSFFKELKRSVQQRQSLFSSKKAIKYERKVSLKREDYRHILSHLLQIV